MFYSKEKIEKPRYNIVEIDDKDFETFKKSQQRGDDGFGSSGK